MTDEFEARILTLIDGMVEHGSDDELFASGYLRGHLALAVAGIMHLGEHTPEVLKTQVHNSLQQAIHAGELSPRDQVLVIGMWDDLFTRALQPV